MLETKDKYDDKVIRRLYKVNFNQVLSYFPHSSF
jgi:hypothetical protein